MTSPGIRDGRGKEGMLANIAKVLYLIFRESQNTNDIPSSLEIRQRLPLPFPQSSPYQPLWKLNPVHVCERTPLDISTLLRI
jgi:hypothetical protein